MQAASREPRRAAASHLCCGRRRGRRLVPATAYVLPAALFGVFISLPAVGSAAEMEPPFLTHTAVRCSVSEAGNPELQV